MNLRFWLIPLCVVVLILTTLLIFEKHADQFLSIPYAYTPDNSKNLAASFKNLDLQDTTLFWEVIAQHTQSSEGLTAANETLSAGVCVFDANNDGWMDLFVVGGSGFSRHYGRKSWWNNAEGNRLLINDNGQRFVDLTQQSGLQQRQFATSCAIADLDLDGLQDIVITGYGQNRLFKQTDKLKFVDVTPNSGILSDNWSTGAAIGDFNNDGLADLYITNLVQFEKGKRTFEQDTGFKSAITENFSPTLYDPEPNRLYLNLGNLQFKSVEKELKIDNAFGRSLFAKWHDFNDDDWLDLIVINDFKSPNQIYLNQSGKAFVPAQEGFSTFHLAGSRDMAIIQPHKGQYRDNYAYFFSRSAGQSNVLLSKASSASFEYVDKARSVNLVSNLRLSTDNWGVIAADINNDGYQDIYQTSGSLIPDQESNFVTQSQSNNLYINSVGGFSLNIASKDHRLPVYSSRAVASADLNNDGQLELIVANNNGPLQILSHKATSEQSWLGLEMDNEGQSYSPNRAKIEIRSDNNIVNYTLDYKQSLFAQSDPRIHLGLADLKSNVELKVSWPDGQVVKFSNVAINHYYRINKSTGQIKLIVYPIENSSNKIVELSKNANQQGIHHLLDMAFFANDKNALKTLWSKANSVDKIKLLNRIAKDTNLQNQSWLFSALQDPDDQVVLAALHIFRQKEWDHSVVYLLPLFDHQNEQVVCAVAQMFAFFFDEEEAVPERKGLAVAPIMRSLGSSDNPKKLCLLDALAAAENKRAVLSVIDTLNSYSDTQVQSKAIQTLGLIRDARANIEIKRVLQTTQSAQVTSAALVALQRLNDNDFAHIFNQTFTPKPNEDELIRKLDSINLLLTGSDGVVISRSLVIDALTELTDFIDNFDGSSAVEKSLLQTISNANDRRFQAVPNAFLANKNPQNQAVIALLKIGDTAGRQKAAEVLLKLNDQDLLFTLGLLGKQNVYLSLDTIKQLANRSTLNNSLFKSILNLSHKMGRENYQRWLIEVLERTDDVKTVQMAINFAIRYEVKGQINLQNLQWGKKPKAIARYLEWQYIQSVDYSANQLLKLRLMLNRLLHENQLSIEERQTLLILAAKHDPFVANNFLLGNKLGITAQQIAAIFIELPPLQRTKEQITLFERILNNQDLPMSDRLVAAVGLLSIHPDRKHEILAKL